MYSHELSQGEGRTKISLSTYQMGEDIVVFIYNLNAHLGAVALADYDQKQNRVSTSVVTRLGHKDDILAQKAAYLISRSTKRPVCVIAGVHIVDISEDEIDQVLENTQKLVDRVTAKFCTEPSSIAGSY